MGTSIKRAELSPDLTHLRTLLASLVPTLEAQPEWYGSVYFERKASKTFSANLRQTQRTDQVSTGVVLRIYDGATLYEAASDELDPDALKNLAHELIARVKAAPGNGIRRPYTPPSWKERLGFKLEPELTSQLPSPLPSPTEPVHFGIRYEQDPLQQTGNESLERVKSLVERCKALAPKVGLSPTDLSYIMARQTCAQEESIFIDRAVNLSQTLYRLSVLIITMSGADRTYHPSGGLGGLEAAEIEDEDILDLLRNLKALKSASRIEPGKFRLLCGPVLTGVLAHEAFGHSQEGDTCARGRSKAWELHKTGARVGNEHATILNNPAVYQNADKPHGAWGSYFFDEEGWFASEQVLLDKGYLKPPMTNLTSAIRLGVPRTANGKRESWANGVYTRQTNTYFSAGDKTLAEMMSQLGDGYLAEHPAGGMEDPKGMGIQVGISFLQEVKDGKLTGRVFKGPSGGDIQMTGYTPDILNSILSKSKIEYQSREPDRARHPFNDTGGCGKYHKEFVVAGCGGPYLLLDGVILG